MWKKTSKAVMLGLMAGMVVSPVAAAEVPAASVADSIYTKDYVDLLQLSSKMAWGMDLMDRALLEEVFKPDARASYRMAEGEKLLIDISFDSFDEMFRWLDKLPRENKAYSHIPWHFHANHIIDIDGDKATMRFFMHDRFGSAGGLFHTKVEKGAEGWRISEMRFDGQTWNSAARVSATGRDALKDALN